MNTQIPHLRVVVSVSTFVLVGFAGVSVFVLGWTEDEVTKGNIIGTWVNFAMLAVGFWLGSSSGGKSKSEDPQPVTIQQPPSQPVPVVEPEFARFDEEQPK